MAQPGGCEGAVWQRQHRGQKGNDYRLIVAFAYRMQWAFIKFVGTHAQYDQVDAATVDQSKE